MPDRPLIQVLAKTSTSIALNWAIAPNDGGKPVTSVTVEYAPMNISKWQRTTVPYPGSSRHTIKNLTPSTQYTVQVRAVNEIGQSHPSVNEVTTDQVNGGGIEILMISYTFTSIARYKPGFVSNCASSKAPYRRANFP